MNRAGRIYDRRKFGLCAGESRSYCRVTERSGRIKWRYARLCVFVARCEAFDNSTNRKTIAIAPLVRSLARRNDVCKRERAYKLEKLLTLLAKFEADRKAPLAAQV